MSEIWVTRLEKRLTNLADTASKESIQALAKWIGFNRKHSKAFSKFLAGAIAHAPTPARQWVYLQVVHEALVLDSGNSRWDRFADMRENLGELTMIEIPKKGTLNADTIKKIEALVKHWDTVNAFGGPTLISQIRRSLSSPAQTDSKKTAIKATTAASKPVAAATSEVKKSPSDTASPEKESPKNKAKDEPKISEEGASDMVIDKEEKKTSATPKGESFADTTSEEPVLKQPSSPPPKSSTNNEVVYDFESKGIAYGKVDSREFLDPCKAIATLQIARDLRNDAAVQLSSLLSATPDDLKQLCEKADKRVKETGQAFELSEDKARDFALRTSEQLLDMDMNEQLQNVRTFIEIVEKQREARQRLIHLLIQSRCQFGANDAAEAFYNLDDTVAKLKTRKETLLDAMALEGLDFEEADAGAAEKQKQQKQKLEPLTWYKKEDQEPDAKRQKMS